MTPADIRSARERAGLTQTQAAAIVNRTLRTWQHWEAGTRTMGQGFQELFRLKVAALKAPPKV